MSNVYNLRKRLKNHEEFVLSLALSGKKESVLSAEIGDLKAAAFIIKNILNGSVEISSKLYEACKRKKLFNELLTLHDNHVLEKTLLEDCKKGGDRKTFIKFLPIISLLLECLLD